MRLRSALALAALATLASVAAAPMVRADAVDDEIKAFEEYLATKPDSQGIRNRIADIALKKDPRIAKQLLMPMVKNGKYDDEVRIAAMQNVGKQGDKTVGGQLLQLADSKQFEEKPKLIAAAIEGAGDADAKGHYKELIKAVRTWVPKNGDIACAAIRAASLHNTRETVDDLLKVLADTESVTTADNAVKQDSKRKAKVEVISCLKKMTGEQINDAKAWKEWWGRVEKTYAPPAPGGDRSKDLNASETYTDAAYGFTIKRPNKAWTVRKSDDGRPYLRYEALDDGQPAAWVEMYVYGTKGVTPNTPDGLAKKVREDLEPKFKDLKEAVWEKKCKLGGQNGIEQILKGRHKDHDAVSMHNAFVDKSEIMYYFIGTFKSGKKASLEEDIEELLKSFVITR
jgi:hypothetical protein